MKSNGESSETKMPVYLAEFSTAMREAAEKSEQRRIKPNKASRSRKSGNKAINISNHCAEEYFVVTLTVRGADPGHSIWLFL